MVSEDVFRNTRIYAVKKRMDISSFTEQALREKIDNIQREEREQQKQQELATTITVAKRLYQQIKQKPDFDSTVSADFIKSITAGIESEYHDYVIKAITEGEKEQEQKGEQQISIFKDDTADPKIVSRSEPVPTEISAYMPEIKFPITKDEILVLAFEPLRAIFEILPDKKYSTKEEFEKVVCEVYNNNRGNTKLKNIISGGEMLRFRVYSNEQEYNESPTGGRIEIIRHESGYSEFFLPSIKFPINRSDLLSILSREDYNSIADEFRIIKDKMYNNVKELEDEIVRAHSVQTTDPYSTFMITKCKIHVNNNAIVDDNNMLPKSPTTTGN